LDAIAEEEETSGKGKIVGTTLSAITQMKKLCNRNYFGPFFLLLIFEIS
jgi:hypothetical protein